MFKVFSLLMLNAKILSKYPKANGKILSASFINYWKCMGAWAKPNGTFLNPNFPNIITKADFFCALDERAIWQYTKVQSNE